MLLIGYGVAIDKAWGYYFVRDYFKGERYKRIAEYLFRRIFDLLEARND
jgi:hypothetical protein